VVVQHHLRLDLRRDRRVVHGFVDPRGSLAYTLADLGALFSDTVDLVFIDDTRRANHASFAAARITAPSRPRPKAERDERHDHGEQADQERTCKSTHCFLLCRGNPSSKWLPELSYQPLRAIA